MSKIRLALFASGSGTNVENIILYFQNHSEIEVTNVFSNSSKAFVLQRVKKYNVPAQPFTKEDMNSSLLLEILQRQSIDFLILAGFLWLVPQHIIDVYRDRIVNIHPALLPAYGGKGMYGDKVHQRVWENSEPKTGITIHKVTEHYDKGQVLFQTTVALQREDTPNMIAEKVHNLEYKHYPAVIERFVIEEIKPKD